MPNQVISRILEELHQIEGLPRLEIEGCRYPVNERLIESYLQTPGSIPEPVSGSGGTFTILHLDSIKKAGSNWLWWIKKDGYGGQVGSINVESKYLDLLDTVEGNKCAYIIREKFDRKDYYYTEINFEYILFRKLDLIRGIESALSSKNKTDLRSIRGTRVLDDVIWDDSLPSGPGLRVTDINIDLHIDLTNEEPKYRVEYI